jgi:hypothetical protein
MGEIFQYVAQRSNVLFVYSYARWFFFKILVCYSIYRKIAYEWIMDLSRID